MLIILILLMRKKLVFFSVSVPIVRPFDLQWKQYEWVCKEDSDDEDDVMSCHCRVAEVVRGHRGPPP